MHPSDLWQFLLPGYALTILIETPVLALGLSRRHTLKSRLLAGAWLTACTYPIVVLVLPLALSNVSRFAYLVVAETFAPVAECALFWFAFGRGGLLGTKGMWRDFAAIVAANIASFAAGEILSALNWIGWFG